MFEPNETIYVIDYDEDPTPRPHPATYLFELENELHVSTYENIGTTAEIALMVAFAGVEAAAATGEAAIEAGSWAARLSRLRPWLQEFGRFADAFGIVAEVIHELRGELGSTPEGREFVWVVQRIDTIISLIQLGEALSNLPGLLRELYTRSRRLREILGLISPEESSEFLRIREEIEDALDGMDQWLAMIEPPHGATIDSTAADALTHSDEAVEVVEDASRAVEGASSGASHAVPEGYAERGVVETESDSSSSLQHPVDDFDEAPRSDGRTDSGEVLSGNPTAQVLEEELGELHGVVEEGDRSRIRRVTDSEASAAGFDHAIEVSDGEHAYAHHRDRHCFIRGSDLDPDGPCIALPAVDGFIHGGPPPITPEQARERIRESFLREGQPSEAVDRLLDSIDDPVAELSHLGVGEAAEREAHLDSSIVSDTGTEVSASGLSREGGTPRPEISASGPTYSELFNSYGELIEVTESMDPRLVDAITRLRDIFSRRARHARSRARDWFLTTRDSRLRSEIRSVLDDYLGRGWASRHSHSERIRLRIESTRASITDPEPWRVVESLNAQYPQLEGLIPRLRREGLGHDFEEAVTGSIYSYEAIHPDGEVIQIDGFISNTGFVIEAKSRTEAGHILRELEDYSEPAIELEAQLARIMQFTEANHLPGVVVVSDSEPFCDLVRIISIRRRWSDTRFRIVLRD